MVETQATGPGTTWLIFALMTVAAWGLYGVLLHTGQTSMADPVNGRYKAFLFVGIAYFFTAVVAPLVVLLLNGASWHYPGRGMAWSLLAGIAGAVGAFCVLLAFGSKGSPAVVMSIVFAGAPVVNAACALAIHPPAGGLPALRWQFIAGILLAAVGGCLVTLYKPGPAPRPHAAVGAVQEQSVEPSIGVD
jgi:drug/metabolite transporter (DMT)-like permease